MKDRIIKWLEIEKLVNRLVGVQVAKKVASHTEATEKLLKEVESWKILAKSFSEIECSACHKKIVTYPFGGGYYRTYDGKVLCSNECIKLNPPPKI